MGRARAGLVSGVWVLLVLVAVFGVVLNVSLVRGSGTIYIRADGSIDPPTAPISTVDNVTYIFTSDINDSVVIERDNILVDGLGYTIQGTGIKGSIYHNTAVAGIELRAFNVTLKDTRIAQFDYGILIAHFGNNTLISNTILSNTYGIYLSSSDNNIVHGNNASSNSGYMDYEDSYAFYESGYGIYLDYSDNNTLIGNNASNNEYGICLIDSSNNTLSANRASSNLYNFGITYFWRSDFSPLSNYVDTSNTVDGKPIYYLIGATNAVYGAETNAGTLYLINSKNITIKDVVLTKNWYGIFCWNTINSNIENVTAINNTMGMWFVNSANNVLSGNTIIDNQEWGIYLGGCGNNVLSDNNVSNNSGDGIFLERSDYNTLLSDTCSNNSGDGIVVYRSSRNQLIYNTCFEDGRGGIVFSGSSNNTLFNNTCSNNFLHGIWLADSSDYNTLLSNTCSNNFGGIIIPYYSDNNVLSGNSASSNYWGIIINGPTNILSGNNVRNNTFGISIDSSDNKIFHNNFVENGQQVYIYSSTNVWDDDYPSCGNYWSDYTGIDEKSGSYQNVTGSDGIGDTPYVLDVNSQDRYPLMNPMGSPQPPIAIFTCFPEQPFKGEVVTFDASTSGDRDGSIVSYKWNFGDGNIITVTDPMITHIYTTQGIYTINLTVTDNHALSHSTTKSIPVIIDSTPPTTIHNYDGLWHTADFTITLTATDDLSGVAETYYKINDGPTKIVSADGQPLITTESANNKLEYWSVDNIGNEELPHKILTGIKLDKTYPAIETPSRTPDGDVLPDQSVKVSVNVTDSASGVKNVTLYYTINDGETWTELPMNYNWTTNLYEATIPPQEAGTTVRFRIVAYDHAGNNLTLDGTEPYCVYQVIPEFPPTLILPLFMILTLLTFIFTRRKQEPKSKTV